MLGYLFSFAQKYHFYKDILIILSNLLIHDSEGILIQELEASSVTLHLVKTLSSMRNTYVEDGQIIKKDLEDSDSDSQSECE